MTLYQVMLEAHDTAATVYVVGMLTHEAALQAELILAALGPGTRVVRADLRGVAIIDPSAFVLVARALNRWRDARHGRVAIQFPQRSTRVGRAPIAPVDQSEAIAPARFDIFDGSHARASSSRSSAQEHRVVRPPLHS